MNVKLYKSLDESIVDSKIEKEFNDGTMSQISWHTLKPYIEHAFSKKPGEKIIGLEVSEFGIKAKFEKNIK